VSTSRRVIGALLLLVTCVGLSACGGTAAKTTAASSSSASAPAPASRPVPPVPSRTTPSATSHSKPARLPLQPTATSGALRRAFASFAACLSNNGVKLPAGTDSHSALSLKGVDTKSATYRRALQACIPVVNSALKAATSKHPGAASPSAPSSRPALPPVKVPASVTAIMTRFTACMRAHGVPGFPEPKGASFNLSGTNIDPHTPAYKSAEASCTSILRALDPPG
jgi:hypothetical protein